MRLLAVLFLLALCQTVPALENRLKDHPSPYLAMHGDDPVHWQAWSPAILERAAAEGKLVLISSGYFSCHWCHVMQRESYRDPVVAERLNAGFIAVKLDRELHPAIDAHLIDFVERTQGAGGWPLNVFLTPEGYPLAGLTYVPRDNFLAILDRVQQLWQAQPARAMSLAREAMAEIVRQRAAMRMAGAPAVSDPRQGLLNEALSLADELEGGFGEQSRFPMAPQLHALLKLQQQRPSPRLKDFLLHTLDQMAREGLRDHLAGGFFRYTVDPGWQVPHYEKMLYSQAQLARLYLQAGRMFGRSDYLVIAADTLDFVLQHMAGRDGGYVASLSAVDDKGEEGGPYLWTDAQLAEALGEALLPLARRHWRLSGSPATEGGYLPLAGESPEQLADKGDVTRVVDMLATARQRLLAVRAARGLPMDHKQLAGWNGLLLLALAEAGRQLDEPRYREAAALLGDFLTAHLWDGHRLARAVEGGRAIGQAGLTDYVYVAAGLAAIGKRGLSEQLQQAAWVTFHDREGWHRSAELPLPGMAVVPALMDDVLPSASAMLIALSAQAGDPALRQRAVAATEAGREMVGLSPFWYASHALLLAGLEGNEAQR